MEWQPHGLLVALLKGYRGGVTSISILRIELELSSGIPMWFLAHDRRVAFFLILFILVLLHRFASRFFVHRRVFCGMGGVLRIEVVQAKVLWPDSWG